MGVAVEYFKYRPSLGCNVVERDFYADGVTWSTYNDALIVYANENNTNRLAMYKDYIKVFKTNDLR